MNKIDVIVYGTKRMGIELKKQIECYNTINEIVSEDKGKKINILAYTESVYVGGNIDDIPIIPVEDCNKIQWDYIVIASCYEKEIRERLKEVGVDLNKVVVRDKFYPEDNGRNVSQLCNRLAFLNKIVIPKDQQEEEMYKKYCEDCYFIDLLNRRRFVDDKEIYDFLNIKDEIYYDEKEALKYVLFQNKRLYFPKEWPDQKIQEYHTFNVYTCLEKKSPHYYFRYDDVIKEGDVVADVGGAEGLFALSIINKASKIYIFECDKLWMKPLRATFKPYQEKVIIVEKFISNINFKNYIMLDLFFRNKEVNFIKMDIEGEEQKALIGCAEILQRKNVNWAVATYHRSEDAQFIDAFFRVNGYKTEKKDGYLWIDHDVLGIEYLGEFRKAMLYAWND